MKKLFESATVGRLALRNRSIRSATFEYAYDNDRDTFIQKILPMYETLAANVLRPLSPAWWALMEIQGLVRSWSRLRPTFVQELSWCHRPRAQPWRKSDRANQPLRSKGKANR